MCLLNLEPFIDANVFCGLFVMDKNLLITGDAWIFCQLIMH